MSLGKPDLYIGDQLMQTATGDPNPALAGTSISWGTDDRTEFAPAATLAGQLLIRGAMPSFLNVGAPVGLIDPVSSRCLFAGTLQPLRASPEPRLDGAMRVSFTAASPLAELARHQLQGFDWPHDELWGYRRNRLAGAMPRGWVLDGQGGWEWVNHGRQRYIESKVNWVTLAERHLRSNLQRFNDTSYYLPGAGLKKRLTVRVEPNKNYPGADPAAGALGGWFSAAENKPSGALGFAVLPRAGIGKGIEWEKTPDDMITDVEVVSWAPYDPSKDSYEFDSGRGTTDTTALQDAYGVRQAKIETSLSAYNTGAFDAAVDAIVDYWLDYQSSWRPTELQLPDSRRLDTALLLNMLAVDTRHAVAVTAAPGAALTPGKIRSFVRAGTATWTGKKWITDLTLGRTI